MPERDEERAAARAEATSAGYVLQGIVKAARGFAIYLPNNPLHEKFFEDLRGRLAEHLREHGALALEIEHDTVRCCGETVYANPDLRENLAFRMYADGIRWLHLEEGVEPQELRTLVGVLARPAPDEAEDDIVTRLWAAELPHVRYELAELPPAAGTAALGVAAGAPPPEGAIRRFAAGMAAAPPPPPITLPVPQQIFTITEEEVRELQRQVAREEARSPAEDVSDVLASILAVEREPALFAEFLDILVRLCGDLVLTGRAGQAVTFLRALDRVAADPGIGPENRGVVEQARGRVITDEVLAGLARALAGTDGIDRQDLQNLVAALGRAGVGPFCRLLGEVPGKETRRLLVESLAAVGRGAPELFLPFLEDPRWYLVRNAIYILRRLGDPRASAAVRRCAGHADPRVRREALVYFDEVADPAAEAVFLRLLEDETPALRIAAARGLARRRSRPGAERLFALAASEGFAARGLEERQAVCECLAELAPERALPMFAEMLRRRRWFGEGKQVEEAACAVAGLRRLATPAAVALLREAAGSKRERVREIAAGALRAVARRGAPEPSHD